MTTRASRSRLVIGKARLFRRFVLSVDISSTATKNHSTARQLKVAIFAATIATFTAFRTAGTILTKPLVSTDAEKSQVVVVFFAGPTRSTEKIKSRHCENLVKRFFRYAQFVCSLLSFICLVVLLAFNGLQCVGSWLPFVLILK